MVLKVPQKETLGFSTSKSQASHCLITFQSEVSASGSSNSAPLCMSDWEIKDGFWDYK
jgi:hypothetical protein